jgi:hypothetical protein
MFNGVPQRVWVKVVICILLALVAIFGGKDAIKGFKRSVSDALIAKERASLDL